MKKSIAEKPKTELAVNAIKQEGMNLKYATDGVEVDLTAVKDSGRHLNTPKMSKLEKFMYRYERHINVFVISINILWLLSFAYCMLF